MVHIFTPVFPVLAHLYKCHIWGRKFVWPAHAGAKTCYSKKPSVASHKFRSPCPGTRSKDAGPHCRREREGASAGEMTSKCLVRLTVYLAVAMPHLLSPSLDHRAAHKRPFQQGHGPPPSSPLWCSLSISGSPTRNTLCERTGPHHFHEAKWQLLTAVYRPFQVQVQ